MIMASREIPEIGYLASNGERIRSIEDTFKSKNGILKSIDASRFGSKIYFTDFGTVIINKDSSRTTQELTLEDFVKKIESEINNNESRIKYSKANNRFYLVDCFYGTKTAYEFDINPTIMEEYAFGTYNDITSKLHDLYLKSMSTEEQQELLEKKEKETQEVIEKADIKHELLTPAEARIYLDYLEEQKRENDKIINDNRKIIAKYTGIPVGGGAAFGTFISTLADSTPLTAAIGVVMGTCCTAIMTDGYLSLYKDEEYVPIPGYTTYQYLKEKVKTIKNEKEKNKIINTKSKKLHEIENIDKMVMAKSYSIEEFDKTIDEEKTKPLNLQNSTLNNIDVLLDRINLLNVEDKKVFLAETKDLLTDYTQRYTNILNRDNSIIDLEADNFVKLKSDILIKIADIESRILEVRQKDVERNKIENETRLLTDKIEGFTELSDYYDEIDRIHELTNKKVKVLALKERKNA